MEQIFAYTNSEVAPSFAFDSSILVHPSKVKLLHGFLIIWQLAKWAIFAMVVMAILMAYQNYLAQLPTPMSLNIQKAKTKVPTISAAQAEELRLNRALEFLKCPEYKLADVRDGVLLGARRIHVDPLLILSIAFTESEFKLNAVSSKGYKSIMQTKVATREFYDVDILHGCRILQQKMNSPLAKRKGVVDMKTALALYKGGTSKQAYNQAGEVLALYKQLRAL